MTLGWMLVYVCVVSAFFLVLFRQAILGSKKDEFLGEDFHSGLYQITSIVVFAFAALSSLLAHSIPDASVPFIAGFCVFGLSYQYDVIYKNLFAEY